MLHKPPLCPQGFDKTSMILICLFIQVLSSINRTQQTSYIILSKIKSYLIVVDIHATEIFYAMRFEGKIIVYMNNNDQKHVLNKLELCKDNTNKDTVVESTCW